MINFYSLSATLFLLTASTILYVIIGEINEETVKAEELQYNKRALETSIASLFAGILGQMLSQRTGCIFRFFRLVLSILVFVLILPSFVYVQVKTWMFNDIKLIGDQNTLNASLCWVIWCLCITFQSALAIIALTGLIFSIFYNSKHGLKKGIKFIVGFISVPFALIFGQIRSYIYFEESVFAPTRLGSVSIKRAPSISVKSRS